MSGLDEEQLRFLRTNNRTMYAALSAPCVDCHIAWHPLVMTFDHRDRAEKKYTISSFRTASPKTFKKELAKCDVVCRNCHQIREYLRDINVLEIGEFKKSRYKYYERMVPYLLDGATIRLDAYQQVPIGVI